MGKEDLRGPDELTPYFSLFRGDKRYLSEMNCAKPAVKALMQEKKIIGQHTLPNVLKPGVDVLLWMPTASHQKNERVRKP